METQLYLRSRGPIIKSTLSGHDTKRAKTQSHLGQVDTAGNGYPALIFTGWTRGEVEKEKKTRLNYG